MKVFTLLLALSTVAYTAASGEGEEHPFEMAAAFDISEAEVFTWLITKESGEEGHDEHGHGARLLSGEEEGEPEYPFDHNRIAFALLAGPCTAGTIESVEEDAEALLNESVPVPEMESGETQLVNTSASLAGIELHVAENTFTSLWLFDVVEAGCFVIFSEARQDGFLRNDHGEEVEPTFLVVDPAPEFEGYSAEVWLVVLGAVAIVSLTAFLGAALLLCGFESTAKAIADNIDDLLTFAAGVILGLCFFHLLPEAVEFNGGFDWEMSLTLAVTTFVSLLVKMAFGGTERTAGEAATILDKKEVEAEELANDKEFSLKEHSTSLNLLWGDFFCNFADGVVIAASFAICADSTLGWLLTGAIILHEAPQEISDLLVIYEDVGSVKVALCINFLSACGAFFGAILVLGLGNLSGQVLGLLLAAGAMALIFVCLVEIAPRVVTFPNKERALLRLVLIIIGFIIMGLTILAESGHCELGGKPGEAEVHGHE